MSSVQLGIHIKMDSLCRYKFILTLIELAMRVFNKIKNLESVEEGILIKYVFINEIRIIGDSDDCSSVNWSSTVLL